MDTTSRGALCVLMSLAAMPAAAAPELTPQYVIVSFDGAGPNAQWRRSRALAVRTGARFTYFLSCVYLLTRETRDAYDAPAPAPGRSNVGFAPNAEDVAARLGHIWQARAEGHEIASHGCGHFDGAAWSEADWAHEFDAFDRILAEAWTINGIEGEPEGWRDFAAGEIDGFRAPYLATGDAMFAALGKAGFAYDASGVSQGPRPPEPGRPLRFALPMIPEGPEARPVIAMDYNFFARHTDAVENDDLDGAYEERTLAALRAALDRGIAGERVPLQIGYHFTLMNGGAYWRALERFLEDACTRPQVRCVSYRDYLKTLPTEAAEGGDADE